MIPPRVSHVEISPFGLEEARQFLAAIKGDRLEALYTVALALGLRQGEALGLRWEDVDLENGNISISHALQRIGGKLTLVEPKSTSSRRTIPLPPFAIVALSTRHTRQAEERLLAGADWQETKFVFTTKTGAPFDPSNVWKYYKRVLGKAGLRDQRLHDLRHCCASLLLVQGVSPRTVMEILGHSQISLTMNTYTHVVPELKRQATDQLDDLLGPLTRVAKATVSTPVGVNSGVIEVDLVADTDLIITKTPALAGVISMSRDGLEPSTIGLKGQWTAVSRHQRRKC